MPKHFIDIFQHFKRILKLNNKIMEDIAHAERLLGGDYLFDRAFLVSFVTKICEDAREVIYNLNGITKGKYVMLYDRLDEIKRGLEGLLYTGEGPWDRTFTIRYSDIKWDFDSIVGEMAANLLHMRNDFGIRTPDGFCITKRAYYVFLEYNDLLTRIREIYKRHKTQSGIIKALNEIFKQTAIPPEVEDAVLTQLNEFTKTYEKNMKLVLKGSPVLGDEEIKEEGIKDFLYYRIMNVECKDIFNAYREVIKARFMPEVIDTLPRERAFDIIPIAICVEEMIEPAIRGVVYSLFRELDKRDYIKISAGSSAPPMKLHNFPEEYYLLKAYPYPLVKSKILKKTLDDSFYPFDPFSPVSSGLMRGNSLLSTTDLKLIAENVMLFEKVFGTPRMVEWIYNRNNQLVMLNNFPMEIEKTTDICSMERLEEVLKGAHIILEGLGETVQSGVAAGRVVHVDSSVDTKDIPLGAICVARYAHPMLTPILKRAGALITDIGNSTGHLATIAREFRVPAIFGAKVATKYLKEGMDVTVDAGEKRVYKGILKELLEVGTRESHYFFESPELKTLKRILNHIAPLYLTDPHSPNFSPEGCRTIHDIIHYCHEKAIDGLINTIMEGEKLIKGQKGRVYILDSNIPLNIRIIDLGGGIADDYKEVKERRWYKVTIKDIQSIPFLFLFKGLMGKGAWDTDFAPFELKDLVSSMFTPGNPLVNSPEYGGGNLAIIAREYMNLSLFLGYHFNVIDSFASPAPDNNYVYFRFGGGFADEAKREKRIKLIQWIMEGMGFIVEIKRDILVGKLKGIDMDSLKGVLEQIGRLIVYTRQLDVRMVDDKSVERFYKKFMEIEGRNF